MQPFQSYVCNIIHNNNSYLARSMNKYASLVYMSQRFDSIGYCISPEGDVGTSGIFGREALRGMDLRMFDTAEEYPVSGGDWYPGDRIPVLSILSISSLKKARTTGLGHNSRSSSEERERVLSSAGCGSLWRSCKLEVAHLCWKARVTNKSLTNFL